MSRKGRKAAPAICASLLKSWGRCAPHRDTRPLLQAQRQPSGRLDQDIAVSITIIRQKPMHSPRLARR